AQDSDFGGQGMFQLGACLMDAGQGVGHAANVIEEHKALQEVTDAQTQLAKTRADWTLALQDRENSADSKDPNFAAKFNQDFSSALSALEPRFETRHGRAAFRTGAGELSAHFVERSGMAQGRLAGIAA